jgi:hypothetical protein
MADYNYIVKSIFNAKPKYNVSFDRANGTVNIGGVGYRGGSLSRAFKSSGSSSDILNNFFKANKDPQKTKREVEKISKGKIKVKIGKGYGNEPIVYYSLKESVNEGKSDLDMVVDTIRKEYENVSIKKLAYHLANRTTYTIDQLLKVLRVYKDMSSRDRDKTDLKKLFKSYGLKESTVNEGILQDREKQLKNLKQGGTVSGGGYGPFKKTGRDTFVSVKGIKHNSSNLVKLIGGFSDFKVDESVNEEKLKPKKLTQLKKGEKFVFNNTPYEFVELYTDISNAAKVKKEDGKTSVVSFGGGVVNKNTKSGFSDYLKQGGRVWDNVNPNNSPSVNERYRPNLESKGWEAAQKVIKQLQSSVFRKLDDDELLEFRKAIADAFNLDGVLKENNIEEANVTKTFYFKGKTSTDIDEIDADFSRKGIKSKPDFNKMKVTVTGDERKIDKIAKFYRGIEEATINERRGGMDIIRRIVKNHQYEGGVDVQTANMILKVYDKVDNKTKKFLDHATLKQIVNLILKARR